MLCQGTEGWNPLVGMGWVGASVAASILHKRVASELLRNDGRARLAEGKAMDLAHGASFYPTAHVRAAATEEMVDADAIIIAAGTRKSLASMVIRKQAERVSSYRRLLATGFALTRRRHRRRSTNSVIVGSNQIPAAERTDDLFWVSVSHDDELVLVALHHLVHGGM